MIVKICGMREGENITDVERLQPDMMGFICWAGSKRYVETRPSYLPAIPRVGVFVDAAIEEIVQKVSLLGLTHLQLHGNESPGFCRTVSQVTGLPILKALPIVEESDFANCSAYVAESSVDMLLFDTKCDRHGGCGKQFNWDILQSYKHAKPFLLAGGIGPDDAHRILAIRHPAFAGVDLNSQFESRPGVKDINKLKHFINIIRNE